MNTRSISQEALNVAQQYLHFRMGTAEISLPYLNNRRTRIVAGFAAQVGKGSPKEIFEEIQLQGMQQKINPEAFDSGTLKNFLVENSIGIDCSGFAYYVLDAESRSRSKGGLDRHLSFPYAGGFIRRLKAKMHPAKNAGARTFAHQKNSNEISVKDAQPGDFITMISEDIARDHIIVITHIDYQNFVPSTIRYMHSIAWPTDGEFNHGVREGKIEITDPEKPIKDQRWIENDKTGAENYTSARAVAATTTIRRFRWF